MMDGMVVFMDQEMAYDRVEWEWLIFSMGRIEMEVDRLQWM